MARERRPEDWERDLAGARAEEARLAAILRADARLSQFEDHTAARDRLDFSFWYRGAPVQLDLKEKIRPTSPGLASLWPEVAPKDLFVLDETVYRRVVWHGGGGYLVIHDHPGSRWVIFGPWELTLGPRLRYARWIRPGQVSSLKGKVLLDLSASAHQSEAFAVDDLLGVIDRSRQQKEAVGPVEIAGRRLPEVGEPG